MTRTYAILEVAPSTHAEIAAKLEAAGYDHAFHAGGVVDLHGIAIKPSPELPGPRMATIPDAELARLYRRIAELEQQVEDLGLALAVCLTPEKT